MCGCRAPLHCPGRPVDCRLFQLVLYMYMALEFHFQCLSCPSSMSLDPDPDILAWTVDTILRDHTPHPLASIRQSSCIWLLCLLSHASSHPTIQVHVQCTCIVVLLCCLGVHVHCTCTPRQQSTTQYNNTQDNFFKRKMSCSGGIRTHDALFSRRVLRVCRHSTYTLTGGVKGVWFLLYFLK